VKVSSIGVVKVEVSDAEISAGGKVDAPVKLVISRCYHINANPPTFSYLKATELEARAGEGIGAEKPLYPPASNKKFSFADQPLAVYEGAATIKLPLTAAPSAPKGLRAIPLKLHVQACDDQACYPPGVIDAELRLTVK
jgi:thioredoxin:protein disulfide reductase